MLNQSRKHWREVLSVKQLLHWVPVGRSGGFYHAIFPDLPTAKADMPKRIWQKLNARRVMARASRRANR